MYFKCGTKPNNLEYKIVFISYNQLPPHKDHSSIWFGPKKIVWAKQQLISSNGFWRIDV